MKIFKMAVLMIVNTIMTFVNDVNHLDQDFGGRYRKRKRKEKRQVNKR